MLEPIKTDKLYKLIMERISKLIDEEKLAPGDKLPSERELALSLSVSRASVRQAIVALAAKGLLVMRQGDGTYISDPGEEKGHILEGFGRFLSKTQLDPEDILESRILVECEASRLCTIRATDEQISKIKAIHLSKIDADPDESGANTLLNRELHYAIAEGAQNQVLLMFMEVLWNTMEDNMWPLLKKESISKYERKKSHDQQHEAIVSAICARDGDKAYKAMYAHLSSKRIRIEKVMEKP
jgi:DNA-binding FadR family transcriptional regulator